MLDNSLPLYFVAFNLFVLIKLIFINGERYDLTKHVIISSVIGLILDFFICFYNVKCTHQLRVYII